jgi:hypothetical protein
LKKAYVKVKQSICRNRCSMHGCLMILKNALAFWKNINFVKPSLDGPFGIFNLHMLLYELLIWRDFLFEFKCLKFCKRLMWKLINISAETGAEWVHNVANECISHLKNIWTL